MRSRLSPRRGVTLLELGLIGAAVALAVGVAFLVFTPVASARAGDSAIKDAQRIHDSAESWREETPKGCPTITQLQHEKKLSTEATTDDPWGQRYRIECEGDTLRVISPGADGKRGTGDDIRVPRS
jgi:hypothetical protein